MATGDMHVDDVLAAIREAALAESLEPPVLGPCVSALELDAIEQELGVLLPSSVRDFLIAHGRLDAWDVASTTPLAILVQEARSLTETLKKGSRFSVKKFPFLAPVHAGDAVALIVGSSDAGSVGYSFTLAHVGRRREEKYWFFWRDEYAFEEVADSFPGWLDAFLGFALAQARRNR